MSTAAALKIITVNLTVLLTGLIGIELVFGTWFQEAHALHQFTKPRNVALVQPNPFPGDPTTIQYTRDEYGFRGLDTDIGNIDIITVGGSTTDQRFLDDSKTFQSVLKAKFAADRKDVHIVNAGIDGQSTVGHISNFASWFDKIDGLRSRYILYYVGINDVLRLSGNDSDVVTAQSPALTWQLYIREKSVFYQLYILAKQYLRPHPLIHAFTGDNIAVDQPLVDQPLIQDYSSPQVTASLEQLKNRIRELASLTRKMNAMPIFVTQRSARWNRKHGRVMGIAKYDIGGENEFSALGPVNGVDIYNIENLISQSIIKACQEVGGICLDLMQEIKFDLRENFYDPVHTTSSGAVVVGNYLYEHLKGRI